MNDSVKQQMQEDIELAKAMTSITSPKQIMELVNNLISYLDLVSSAIADYEYKASQLKGKKRTLEEYIRTGKEYQKNMSIAEYQVQKLNDLNK